MHLSGFDILIGVLIFAAVVSIGASILVSISQKKKVIEERLHDKKQSGLSQGTVQKKTSFLQFLEKTGNLASHGNTSADLWEQLIKAGYFKKSAPAIYTGIKMLLFVIGLVLTALVVVPLEAYLSTKVTLIFLGGAFLFFAPNVVVSIQLKKRQNEISRHLPEAIDLLEICVTSGIGLEMAWNIVSDEIQNVSPVLANSMALTNFEIHLGVSRVEAMRHMAKRTGVDELSSLAAILIQTERFGTSISDTLRAFAVSMREEKSHAAQENAEKMAVELTVPMVLFIFPAILIVAVGPAIISLNKVLGGN